MRAPSSLTLETPPTRPAEPSGRPAPGRRRFWSWDRASGALLLLVVLSLTVLAGAVRLHGLAAPDGQLGKDEAKLALVS